MLSKADIVYTFTRSRIDDNYVYIQKNDGKRKAYREYLSELRHERRSIGVKFYDAKGSGRIINGIKRYD